MNEQTLIGLVIAIIEFGTLLYLAALGELIGHDGLWRHGRLLGRRRDG